MPKKLLLVILSAILMPVVASAQSFLVDYFPVLVYGDTDIYKQVFNGVAVMFNNKTTVGFVTNVVGILAFIMIVWRLTFKHGSAGGGETGSAPWEMFFKQFAFLCIIMFVFLNPAFKSTVTIQDQRAFFGKQTIGGGATIVKVDNVPTVLAFVASGTSYLGHALVNLVDTAFANSRINGTRYSDVGFMTNFRFIARTNGTGLGEGDANDPKIKKERNVVSNLRIFVEKCAIPYQTLTGDTFDALDFGFPTLDAWDPKNWLYYDNVKFLEAAPGIGCKDFYADIANDFNGVANSYEKRSIEAMGMNPGTAGPALKAMAESVLAAPSNVAGPASKMNGYTQYHLRASLDGVVAAARYADSFGVTGANAEAMNQSILSASAKMTDVTSQARFLFSAQTLPKALHILIALLYAIFPFMLVVVAIRGYPEGLKVLYYFAGGMLSMELIKMSLAIVHNLVSYITAVDGATLLHAASVAGNNIDYDKVIHGHKYYQYMAEQATLAADIGTAAMFMIPMVIATGQVKLLGSALGGAVSAHAPNQGIQGSQAEMAKANDAENRNMDSVVAGYSTAAVMKGIEENNAAIASISKMDNYNDFNKGQVGQQMQQIGSVAGYGSELNSEKDFQNVLSGGKFQGVQSVSNMKSLGQEFESDQNFKYAADTNGRALARTLGNDATAKTIGSARGLIAGDFFDKDGNLSGGREGNIYTQGLENQARISANQTAGVGKLGEFTREQMNAIQYGAEAGALNQIAQGNSLRRVFGTGAGFQESYSAMANTQADMQNYTARETTRSAREHFGNSLRGGGSSGISFADAARGNADLKHDQFAGTALGYNDAMAYAKENEIKGSPFQEQARSDTKTKGNITSDNIKQGKEGLIADAGNKAMGEFVDGNSSAYETVKNLEQQNADMQNEIEKGFYTSSGPNNRIDRYAPQIRANQAKIDNLTSTLSERMEATGAAAEEAARMDPNLQQKALDQQVKADTAAGVEERLQRIASYQGAVATGALNPSTGTFSQDYRAGVTYNAAQGYANVLTTAAQASNTNLASFETGLRNMGMDNAQVANIMSGASAQERLIRLAASTGTGNIRGTFNGMSFNINASADGQFNGSFDSRVSRKGGYTSDMGDMHAAAAYNMNGVSGMTTYGNIKTAYNGISSAISVGTDFMGGIGKVGKMAKGFGGGRAAPSNGGGVTGGVLPNPAF